jgi:hypothetical protein
MDEERTRRDARADLTSSLQRYARANAALFPIPAGQKNPIGIIASFKHDWSKDPQQWERWADAYPGCNWGMVAGPSRKVIADIDTKRVGHDAAWAKWVELCNSWREPVFSPQIRTPSGGYHRYFDVPDDVDACSLRQPPLVPGIIDVRAGWGFVLIPPSVVDGKPYYFSSKGCCL